MRLSHCFHTEILVSNFDWFSQTTCRTKYCFHQSMEKWWNPGDECSIGSRSCCLFDSTKGFSFWLFGTLKGKLAIRLFKSYPELKKKPYWGNHFWARGCFVSTIGLDAEMIKWYVKYQEKKEREDENSWNLPLLEGSVTKANGGLLSRLFHTNNGLHSCLRSIEQHIPYRDLLCSWSIL